MPYRELDVAGEGEKGVDDENMMVLTGIGHRGAHLGLLAPNQRERGVRHREATWTTRALVWSSWMPLPQATLAREPVT